ncbi:peptidoglycan editing factor PgeF [Usitatibacter palustris]|uniref:Purine nucleoside phosphorylase n=1 Tax=Usitatibacter palustris TaxID=2732487 RepID=A0A6M4H9G3_9PROT|nr:peptidoglycan editing factor PgeF [Usitatibacter palustris]QJR15488.1 Polyphenol oxidase [Usitatibacter palustris]
MSLPRDWIVPEWPAPANVRAFVTTRAGGVSEGEYGTMNLGLSSGDDRERVSRNRLTVVGHLPEMPQWLAQHHGVTTVRLENLGAEEVPRADAAITAIPGRVCAVLTADCMPLLLCNDTGTQVAVVHAGWRGMAAGVIESAVAAMGIDTSRMLAWMGPTIGPGAFEVGPEVREAFMAVEARAAEAFAPHVPGKYLADLYTLARQRLGRCGVTQVFGGGFCTFTERERFFSYRRVKESGRLGSFIWMAN